MKIPSILASYFLKTTALGLACLLSACGSNFSVRPAGDASSSPVSDLALVKLGASAGIAIDVSKSANRSSASTRTNAVTLSTAAGNELLLALISTDYESGANTTVTGVSGAGLTWQLVVRTNHQNGSSEIWRAFAPTKLSQVSVRASLSQSVVSSITVMSFVGVDISGQNGSGAIGAIAGANGIGAPSASLITTRNNSLVIGVGNDWDAAIARRVGSGQTLVHQYLAHIDTFWVQRKSSVTPTAGTKVILNDTAPTGDHYNFSLCEIMPDPSSGGTTSGGTTTGSTTGSATGTTTGSTTGTTSGTSTGGTTSGSATGGTTTGTTSGSTTGTTGGTTTGSTSGTATGGTTGTTGTTTGSTTGGTTGTTTGSAGLLTSANFTFLKSYSITADNQLTWGQGLTVRYVNGKPQLLTFSYDGSVGAKLVALSLPASGSTISSLDASWDNIFPPNAPLNGQKGLYWEDQGNGAGRLWSSTAIDYPDDTQINDPSVISIRKLNADGTVSNLSGMYGLQDTSARAVYGGVQKIPDSFRAKYGISQSYLAGWGGYASRMAGGLGISMGFMAVAIPDPTLMGASNATIPSSQYAILADHRSGDVAVDWYASWVPGFIPPFDRGVRYPNVTNTFDSNGTYWTSPAPDGQGRLSWGDSYYSTGNWIQCTNSSGQTKEAFIAILSSFAGRAWYESSTLHSDSENAELHIFDPGDFGQVLKGTKNSWNVQPVEIKLLNKDLTPLGYLYGQTGNVSSGGVAGATYDPNGHILYLLLTSPNGGYGASIVAYSVSCD